MPSDILLCHPTQTGGLVRPAAPVWEIPNRTASTFQRLSKGDFKTDAVKRPLPGTGPRWTGASPPERVHLETHGERGVLDG